MSEAFWPSVTAATVIVAVSVSLIWLIALVAVKVLRWPSAKTIARWERSEERGGSAEGGPMTPMIITVMFLAPTLPLLLGSFLLGSFEVPSERPDYTGNVIEAGPCKQGALELWWLYRCEAVVEVTEGPVGIRATPPEPPEGPVTAELLAREPVRAGAAVGLETEYDDNRVEREWGLSSETDRPTLVAGMLAGTATSVGLSIPIGLWWRRSRPRISPYLRYTSSPRRPTPPADGVVKVHGYVLVPVIALLLVAAVSLTLWLVGSDTKGLRMVAGLVGLLVAISVIAAARFTLSLRYDQSAEVLSVTRRFWFGPSRQWLIPLDELDGWYYVKDIPSFVLSRHGHRPLSFILTSGDGPERLTAWAEAVLPRHHDPATGGRISKLTKRALMLGFGLGIPLLGAVAFIVLAMIFGVTGRG